MSDTKEAADKAAEATSPSIPPRPNKGLKWYWAEKNAKSLDGLPGILSAHLSAKAFRTEDVIYKSDSVGTQKPSVLKTLVDIKLLVGFSMGVLAAAVYVRLA
jgi:hypothetical protein